MRDVFQPSIILLRIMNYAGSRSTYHVIVQFVMHNLRHCIAGSNGSIIAEIRANELDAVIDTPAKYELQSVIHFLQAGYCAVDIHYRMSKV